MARLAALIFSFWAACSFAGAVLALGVFAAPGSRSSLLVPAALAVLAVIFWRTGMSLWRRTSDTATRVRHSGILAGPPLLLLVWSTSLPGHRSEPLLAVLVGWAMFAALTWWFASGLTKRESIAPAS